MPNYLLFNPTTKEIRGPIATGAEQIIWNTEGGAFRVFNMSETDGWRGFERVDGKDVDVYRLEYLRDPLLAEIDAQAYALIGALVPTGTRAAVFMAKEAEARGKGAKPLLEAEAAETGEKVAELAKKVIANADAVAANAEQIGRIEGKRRAAKAAIKAAETLLDLLTIPAIDWDA